MRGMVKVGVMIALAVLQVLTTTAQQSPKSYYYLSQYNQTSLIQSTRFSANHYNILLGKISKRTGHKSQLELLRYVFKKAHQTYLRNYSEYASFSELSKGKYNCLTGTALFALLLEDLKFDYRIIETNYHIFLVVKTDNGQVLFEATDPLNGFVSDRSAIENRLSRYRQNEFQQRADDKNYYLYSFRLFKQVNLDEMLGLFYYNAAVELYNQHQLPNAVQNLDKAMTLYNSPRVDEFSKLMLFALAQSQLDVSLKETCVKKLQYIRKQKIRTIATASAVKP
jgi:hypothetical protein